MVDYEDGKEMLPKILVNPSIFKDMCSPWEKALIVCLQEKLGFRTMKVKLASVCQLSEDFGDVYKEP